MPENHHSTLKPGLYWVCWAKHQDWDIALYSGGTSNCWWAIGTEEWQDWPDIIGPQPQEPPNE